MSRKKLKAMVLDILFVCLLIAVLTVGMLYGRKEEKAAEAENYHFTILEKDREISALYTDNRYVYVGTDRGVIVYDTATWEVTERIENLSLIYSAGITKTPDGTLWIGHEKGLTGIKEDGTRIELTAPAIPEGRVNALCFDGTFLWAGTYNGAAKISFRDGAADNIEILNKSTGLPVDSVNAFLPVENGMLLGSYLDRNGGVSFLKEDGTISSVLTEDGLAHPYVTSLLELSDGTVLAGTGYMRDGGLDVLERDGNGYRVRASYDAEDGLPGEKIRYLFLSGDLLWITTEYDGVLLAHLGEENAAESYRLLRQKNGLSDDEIKCIIETEAYYILGGKMGITLIPKSFIDE